jgi:hypothetical protein
VRTRQSEAREIAMMPNYKALVKTIWGRGRWELSDRYTYHIQPYFPRLILPSGHTFAGNPIIELPTPDRSAVMPSRVPHGAPRTIKHLHSAEA